jgi:hypothetical protein
MTLDLASLLPVLLPRAVKWADRHSRLILAGGISLPAAFQALAKSVSVTHPDKIRIGSVAAMPVPEDPDLAAAAAQTGLLGPTVQGLTLGYGIYLREDVTRLDPLPFRRLIAHECRHVYQFEVHGSLDAFLAEYLRQVVTVGYRDAPYEVDARNSEAAAG